MIMETDLDSGCVQAADGDSAGLLAEFRLWLDRERGLAAAQVQRRLRAGDARTPAALLRPGNLEART
jgi:hypothetical protein